MKLTPTRMKEITKAVEDSILPLKWIAENAGITDQTLRNWIRNGRESKQKIEDGQITKSDLSIKQKRELELYLRIKKARPKHIPYTMERIHEIAEKEEEIRAYQWLLRMLNPIYRDGYIEDKDDQNKTTDVEVICLSKSGVVESRMMLSEFMRRSAKDAEEKERHTEVVNNSNKS